MQFSTRSTDDARKKKISACTCSTTKKPPILVKLSRGLTMVLAYSRYIAFNISMTTSQYKDISWHVRSEDPIYAGRSCR